MVAGGVEEEEERVEVTGGGGGFTFGLEGDVLRGQCLFFDIWSGDPAVVRDTSSIYLLTLRHAEDINRLLRQKFSLVSRTASHGHFCHNSTNLMSN